MQNENGVLAVQEDFGNALVDKYAPVWDKKYRSNAVRCFDDDFGAHIMPSPLHEIR